MKCLFLFVVFAVIVTAIKGYSVDDRWKDYKVKGIEIQKCDQHDFHILLLKSCRSNTAKTTEFYLTVTGETKSVKTYSA